MDKQIHNSKIISETIEYIEDNLDQDISLDDIAKKAGYSKFYLSRLFSDTIGCTIYKYIQLRRITEAARKLVDTDKPVVDIAFEACYQSQQAFTNAFSRIYQHSPQNYRSINIFAPKMPRMDTIHKLLANLYMSGGLAA